MQLFTPDGRLTPEGLVKILEEMQRSAWICTRDRPSTVPRQQTVVFPSLEEIFTEDGNSTLAYPYNESWEHSKDEIVTIIHTSGTIGESSKFHQLELECLDTGLLTISVRTSKANLPLQRVHIRLRQFQHHFHSTSPTKSHIPTHGQRMNIEHLRSEMAGWLSIQFEDRGLHRYDYRHAPS
jgi:hypothetical protein